MTSITLDMIDYEYRVIFTYVVDPRKIPLPFVRFKPKKAIFNFKQTLTKSQLLSIIGLAKNLNQAVNQEVTVEDEFFSKGVWKKDPQKSLLKSH